MFSSDKQNMVQTENLVGKLLKSFLKIMNIGTGLKSKEQESTSKEKRKKFINDFEKLVEKAGGWECLDSTFIDLSLTGLTVDILQTWGTLQECHDLTSLGVAGTHDQSVITLPDCKDKLKKLKRLRMECPDSGFEKLRQNLGKFGKLNDLTLANMDIVIIPDLPELVCLRLYGCQKETCKIDMNGCHKLKKLVIGDMETVKKVQINSAVLERVVTLKFSNLQNLEEVYTEKKHFLLTWQTSTKKVPYTNNQPKTIFLRDCKDSVKNSSCLEIYKYNKEMQCYKLKPTQNEKV